ncbi:hypothetical protein Clacol_003223 [Clathrus columnatus]|uniref:P-loop containing nucleoside triphosphate hydrolase protein n=1 Tax=Clathrus columnatus TaxID=1419009 RepID=A0AAV5A2Z3_9AGAM|nr:hypothetical protein Clacol_003223 [Clathrus columnatus]
MDSLVWKAARFSTLGEEDLPPIADYDKTEHVVPKGEKMRTTVHLEAIITQLVFDHALEIRVKEDDPDQQNSTPQTKDTRKSNLVALSTPIQFGLSMWFLYKLLGWSALIGMGTTILTIPLPGYVAKHFVVLQKLRLQKTDERVQSITDILSVSRMIKLFGWEDKVSKQIEEKREGELAALKKRQILNILNANLNYLLPLVIMVGTFGGYTIVEGQVLTAATVFSSIAVFTQFRDALWMTVYSFPDILNVGVFKSILTGYAGQVSLTRVDNFLNNTEVLDRSTDDKHKPETTLPAGQIGFRNASFMWGKEDNKESASEERKFRLSIKDNLIFRRGQLNIVIGPTGSGEMHYSPIGDDSGFQLPREGGIALVVQEGWVQSGTIKVSLFRQSKVCNVNSRAKENILFGSDYDEERYRKVILQCGLEQDLSLFEEGDNTEIGEKGLTLSGGQNARVTLAKAVYSKAEIVLIDDILASLDVHTGKFIIDNCFMGDLLKGRTVILVTHNVPLVAPIADFVVSLDINGQIASQGSLNDALSRNERLLEEVMQEQQAIKEEQEIIDAPDTENDNRQGGKLVLPEEVAVGHVSWAAMKLYYSNMGSPLFWLAFVFGMFSTKSLTVAGSWLLGRWAAEFEQKPENVSSGFYLTIYALILFGEITGYSLSMLIWIYGQLRAARRVHNMLISSVLGTTSRWLDTTPTARVIARCTQDITTIDVPLPGLTAGWIFISSIMVTSFTAVIVLVPKFIIPGVIIAVLGFACGQVYMKAQLPIKRQMSISRSPIIAHMNAMLTGLGLVAFMWIAIRSEALGSVLGATLALYILNDRTQNASSSGLALAMAVMFASCIIEWVRHTNELEVQGNSIERIEAYINIVQEPKPSQSGVPPAYWPSSGNIVVENLCARYSSDSPEVLHNINFAIKSGEKVGVVGRTGSGKSTLTLSLLRCIPTKGKVIFDGINTESINLSNLRNSITIIPQRPELLTGTLRDNLDPFSEHSDATLNDALRLSGLFALQEQNDQMAKITLDSNMSSGGANVSVGQRQILALARAILRGSKLLILDEATSAIDYTTDAIIQESLREASRNASLIIVAHRLNTIMDADKIIFLDAGNMVEFDSPANLLRKPDGHFRSLVDESGDREALYEIAEKTAKGCSCV